MEERKSKQEDVPKIPLTRNKPPMLNPYMGYIVEIKQTDNEENFARNQPQKDPEVPDCPQQIHYLDDLECHEIAHKDNRTFGLWRGESQDPVFVSFQGIIEKAIPNRQFMNLPKNPTEYMEPVKLHKFGCIP